MVVHAEGDTSWSNRWVIFWVNAGTATNANYTVTVNAVLVS